MSSWQRDTNMLPVTMLVLSNHFTLASRLWKYSTSHTPTTLMVAGFSLQHSCSLLFHVVVTWQSADVNPASADYAHGKGVSVMWPNKKLRRRKPVLVDVKVSLARTEGYYGNQKVSEPMSCWKRLGLVLHRARCMFPFEAGKFVFYTKCILMLDVSSMLYENIFFVS